MKKAIGLFAASMLLLVSAFGQKKPEVGGGHIPAKGPAPVKHAAPAPKEGAQPHYNDRQGHPNAPHVEAKGDKWVGHDTGPNDARYHLQKIEKPLASLISGLTLPPNLVTTILDTDVGEPWIHAVADFERRLDALMARQRVRAARDLGEVAEGLRIVVWPFSVVPIHA